MTKTCSKCSKSAVTFIRYNGTHLCRDHFIQYFEKRVKKDIKKQGRTEDNCKIGIAISGGKDSMVALHVTNGIFSKREKIDIIAITVNEGIKGYRDESINIASENCKKLGIEHYIVSFKDMVGKTMDEIASKHDELGECSYCGVFRRLCLNKKSKELGVNKLVTGHNLDDMAQSILMNFVNGDVQKLARLGPHKKIQPGLIPRMFPLRVIPEKEVALYAILKNMEYHDGECPYSIRAYRGVFRDIIDDLEYRNPGTRHSILNSYDSIREMLLDKFPPVGLNSCRECGEPTSQNICKACIFKDRIS
ncbi:TIGR00269 family protein [candidate division WOR-3 bacterium]|nr:TIGR00269 family protein [candidate division WOR-3 bacterium]